MVAQATPIANWVIEGKATVILEGRTPPGANQSPHVEERSVDFTGNNVNVLLDTIQPGVYKVRVYVKFGRDAPGSTPRRATALEDVEVEVAP
jgi:hypothetical protein